MKIEQLSGPLPVSASSKGGGKPIEIIKIAKLIFGQEPVYFRTEAGHFPEAPVLAEPGRDFGQGSGLWLTGFSQRRGHQDGRLQIHLQNLPSIALDGNRVS